MKIVFEGQSHISTDQEGEPYFYHGEITWYLNEFVVFKGWFIGFSF